jgi:hypothetical protein
MKMRSLGEELFYSEDGQTDRRTDLTKLIVAFRNFSNAPKTVSAWSYTAYYLMLMGAFVLPYSEGMQPAVWR